MREREKECKRAKKREVERERLVANCVGGVGGSDMNSSYVPAIVMFDE